jgi:hypothetical protein
LESIFAFQFRDDVFGSECDLHFLMGVMKYQAQISR